MSIPILIPLRSLKSGYSRFPVHEPGNPTSSIGLLLIKKIYHLLLLLKSLFNSFVEQLLTYEVEHAILLFKIQLTLTSFAGLPLNSIGLPHFDSELLSAWLSYLSSKPVNYSTPPRIPTYLNKNQ